MVEDDGPNESQIADFQSAISEVRAVAPHEGGRTQQWAMCMRMYVPGMFMRMGYIPGMP